MSDTAKHRRVDVGPDVHRRHGFDVLRLIAASAVIVAHSFFLNGTTRTTTLVVFSDGTGYNLGGLGVMIFFAVSGYLITGSWLASGSPHVYAVKRFARIYPALAVMVLVVCFVIGPIVTSATDYFASVTTYEFLIRNLLVVPYDYFLPGVFSQNPHHETNGVLWTIALEVLCYVLVAVLGRLGVLHRPVLLGLLTGLVTVATWRYALNDAGAQQLLTLAQFFTPVAIFLFGATLRSLRFVPGYPVAAAGAGLLVLFHWFATPLSLLAVPALGLVVIGLGIKPMRRAEPVLRAGDPSYGMYVWGFVLQQLLVHYVPATRSTGLMVGLSMVCALGAGYVSWHLVEQPALTYFADRRARTAPVANPRAAAPTADPSFRLGLGPNPDPPAAAGT